MIIDKHENKEQFDKGCFGTQTTAELLNIVEKTNFEGYEQHFNKNSNGDYNHLMNFFIWKKKGKSEYIRITLLSKEDKGERLFYWNIETSFKPFAYKHNHREKANQQSQTFKSNENEKYINYFKNIINLKGGFE